MDSDGWVRAAAINALGKLTNDSETLIEAVRQALLIPATSFAVVNRALAQIEKTGLMDRRLIPSLAFAIEHPGEGMGAQIMNQAMTLLVNLDPDADTAVPTLTRAAAGGYAYDRLRGNPRKTAIELLGKLGPKAESAVSALERILAGTDEKDQPLRDAARDALAHITGAAPPE